MTHSKNLILFGAVFLILLFCKCQDQWEEHTKTGDGVSQDNIMEVIQNTQNLSLFAECLISTRWDKELCTAKSYTVWAPNNDAMTLVEESVLNDSASLYHFVSNHIAFTQYPYNITDKSSQKVKTYSGKNIQLNLAEGKVDNAQLQYPYDVIANNGILHIIDKPLIPRLNIWEFVESTDYCPMYVGYLNSLTGMVFDASIATQTGIDPNTGKPIYDQQSGMVWNNHFIDNIRDVRNEDSLYTMILITDNVLEEEFNKYRPYFKVNQDDLTDSLTYWNIARDLVFPGKYEPESVPDTLLSIFGVKVPVNKSAMVDYFEASNGIVYILNDCNIPLQHRFKPIIIEGEDTLKYITTSLTGQTGYTRQKELASGGYDFILDNHGANPGNIKYHVGNVCATQYMFYWKAVNDFNASYRYPNANTVLKQKLEKVDLLRMSGTTPVFSTALPISPSLIEVRDSTYTTAQEVFLGQYTFFSYEDLWLQVTGGGSNMTITLDYLKIVPVFN